MDTPQHQNSWSQTLTFNVSYIDPKVKLWLLEANKKAIKGKLKSFQSNWFVPDLHDVNTLNKIVKRMKVDIKKIRSLTRQIRAVKSKM